MLRENESATGRLDDDNLRRAILTNHNTTDRDTGLSPAQVIFGHLIRESLSIKPNLYTPRLLNRDMRELVPARKHAKQEDRPTKHTKVLHGLKISGVDWVQNQHKVKMDSSERVTLRNRKFLDPNTDHTTPPTRSHTTAQTPGTPMEPTQMGGGRTHRH